MNGGETSPFCEAKGGRGAQRRRGFIQPHINRNDAVADPSMPYAATAHPSDKTSACSNTVCVAFSCISGG